MEPGEYALCTDPQHRDFQNENSLRFRGELATVPELEGFPRPTIANGWPMRVRRARPERRWQNRRLKLDGGNLVGIASPWSGRGNPSVGAVQSDHRLEAALRFSINPYAGSFSILSNMFPRIDWLP